MRNDKTQTGVEWYISKITLLEFWVETKQITWKEYHKEKDKLIEQAKEIEKEQMDKVAGDWWNEGASHMHDGGRRYESFEQYYNETYGEK